MSSSRPVSAWARQPKKFEWQDLLRLPVWVISKPLYAVAPPSFFFRVATLRGSLEALTARDRARLRLEVERHLTPDGASRVVRRYLQFRLRARFTSVWPQLRDFDGAGDIEVAGLEHLNSALEARKGVILVSAHFGHSRLIKPILRTHGYSPLLVGPPHDAPGPQDFPPYFTRFGSRVHTSLLRLPRTSRFHLPWSVTVGTDIVTELNLRGPLAALARNEILIILLDGRIARVGRDIPVLGIEIPFASGSVSLARKTGCPVLPAFVVDDPRRHGAKAMKLMIGEPLDFQVTENPNADLQANLSQFARVYAEVIRAYPHNFDWVRVRDGVFVPLQAD